MPPPPMATPVRPPMPRRSLTWPGSSWAPGSNDIWGSSGTRRWPPSYGGRSPPRIAVKATGVNAASQPAGGHSSIPVHDLRQVSGPLGEAYGVVIANGPPDTEDRPAAR